MELSILIPMEDCCHRRGSKATRSKKIMHRQEGLAEKLTQQAAENKIQGVRGPGPLTEPGRSKGFGKIHGTSRLRFLFVLSAARTIKGPHYIAGQRLGFFDAGGFFVNSSDADAKEDVALEHVKRSGNHITHPVGILTEPRAELQQVP